MLLSFEPLFYENFTTKLNWMRTEPNSKEAADRTGAEEAVDCTDAWKAADCTGAMEAVDRTDAWKAADRIGAPETLETGG